MASAPSTTVEKKEKKKKKETQPVVALSLQGETYRIGCQRVAMCIFSGAIARADDVFVPQPESFL